MGKRNTIHKLPEYKGYSAYYYYDDEDKLFVGHVYNSYSSLCAVHVHYFSRNCARSYQPCMFRHADWLCFRNGLPVRAVCIILCDCSRRTFVR